MLRWILACSLLWVSLPASAADGVDTIRSFHSVGVTLDRLEATLREKA